MNPLRIIFVTNNYTPYSGGVVSSINATVKELRQAGHRVDIITLDFLGKQHNDPEYVHRLTCPIKFNYKNKHIALPWRPAKQIFALVQKIQPDIIHTHHPFLLGKSALLAAKKLDIPIVFTYHTLYEEYVHYVPLPQFIIRPLVTKRVLSFCCAVDGIIAPSNAIKNYLETKKVKTPVVKIPSGLQEMYLRDIARIKNNKQFNLLYVGRFAKEKNILFLLNMFAHVSNKDEYSLTLVGYGPEFENIKKYAYTILHLNFEQVRFIYKPSKEQLLQLYAQADLFLFPSYTDTQGLVLAEAMACGTPVIALDGPGQRDIVVDGENGFIVTGQQEMIATIEHIKNNDQLQQSLQQGSLQTAKAYNPKKLVEKLINFYESFCLD